MKMQEAYRDPGLAEGLLNRVRERASAPVRIMEVCGTHTMAIFRTGLRSLLPETITLLSGPGCPVCVTSQGEIDAFVAAARRENVVLATFGDLVRVPGTTGSLQDARAEGADVRVVYSTLDALDLARKNPSREVVFCGVGFETTAPTVAGAILAAGAGGVENFSVLSAHKRVPPALLALLRAGRVAVDGLLCPGHVSVIIGEEAYLPVAREHAMPCVITGFEPVDILQGVSDVLELIRAGRPEVRNAYGRAVRREGNRKALEVMERVFRPGRCGLARPGPHPGRGAPPATRVRGLRRRGPVRHPRGGGPGPARLRLRRGAHRRGDPPRLRPLREGVHARASRGAVHGLQRGDLRGLLPIPPVRKEGPVTP